MLQISFKRIISYTSAILCISACIGDLVLIYVFGNQIPGYNQLTDTLSSLGVSSSPVAAEASMWSVILGLIFVFFAIGFKLVYQLHGKETRKAFWLIVLYGLGEGVASGVFRADRIKGELTNIAILHDLLGGIGIIAVLLLPFVMQKIFTQFSFPLFYRYSRIVWLVGIISTVLFSFRLQVFEGTFLYTYSGLWQRIFLVDYYIYFFVIAIMIIKGTHKMQSKTH